MPAPLVTSQTVWEDVDVVLMARIVIDRASLVSNLVQADVSSIAYKVFVSDVQAATGTLVVSSVVFDSLQALGASSIWTVDSTGFNFKWVAPASLFPNGGVVYRVEIIFTTPGGSSIPLVFNLKTRDLLSS